ncbi:tetratricopeptide repeat protein [Neptunomonas phycophila]|uniref:tetratricopeptide repeat protein n=1 Tax=Neptunomonas phycophila TaxID=1572645 RepID=UPI001BEC262F|nr:tetratricopeptide repeat protein [Neptunomonas phycophila]MBT3147078.1 tetratricopeptide repeat protein [Neptunomonas phycophila]
MDIKRTPLAIILAATMATGCSASNRDDSRQSYCRNGGSTTDYTCDQEKQIPDRELIGSKSLPSTDEAWMQSKLAEIKTWLQQEKTDSNGDVSSTQKPANARISVRDPSATDPELMRIEAMSRKGDHRAAMSAVNSFLANNPENLEGQLTKSLVLNNMGRLDEAESLLKSAINRYPTSPEVYNNLAVLYAEQGDYGQAIETLLQAFSTHPTYAQVHQNLRELYATVASQAYSRALDLNQQTNSPQLVMLRRTSDVNSPDLGYQAASISTQASLSENDKAVASNQPKPAAVEKPVIKPAATVEAKPIEKPVVIAAVKPEVKPETIKPEPPKVEPPKAAVVKAPEPVIVEASTKADEPSTPQLVREAVAHVNAWAKAWAAQDIDGYLNSYTNNYRPSTKLSHNGWVAQRKDRLAKPTFIKVELANVKTTILDSKTAKVTFNQSYQSNTYKDQTNKQLTLTRINGQWLIVKEQSL